MIKKEDVLASLIKEQEKRIEDSEKSYESTRQNAIDAPGSNVSHSDTTKFQLSNLVLGLERRILEAKTVLSLLKSLPIKAESIIRVGSLFTIRNLSSKANIIYLLVPVAGGEFFKVGDEEILSISVEAPLAEEVIGLERGDKIEFRGDTLEIIDVQ